MPTVYFIGPNGGEYQVEAQDGDSVMQAALSGMVDGILGECGGQSRMWAHAIAVLMKIGLIS